MGGRDGGNGESCLFCSKGNRASCGGDTDAQRAYHAFVEHRYIHPREQIGFYGKGFEQYNQEKVAVKPYLSDENLAVGGCFDVLVKNDFTDTVCNNFPAAWVFNAVDVSFNFRTDIRVFKGKVAGRVESTVF